METEFLLRGKPEIKHVGNNMIYNIFQLANHLMHCIGYLFFQFMRLFYQVVSLLKMYGRT